VKVKLII